MVLGTLTLIGKIVGSIGLGSGFVGAIMVGTIRWRTIGTAATTMEGATAIVGSGFPADLPRWRWGWLLIWIGFALQLVGLWIA